MSKIHPTAIISAKAEIGEDVEIGPYRVIADNVFIGAGTCVGPHVNIGSMVRIGKNCQIYNGANIDMPQDYTWKKDTESWTEIGDGTTIREYVTIHRPAKAGTKTVIGSHCFLMAFVHIGHNGELGDHVTLANHATMSGFVKIESGAVVSGYVLAHQFCRIGTLAMVSPRVLLRQDVPPYCLLMDDACIGGLNTVGLKRAGFDAGKRAAIKKAASTFYNKGLSRGDALAEIESWDMTPEQRHFLDFIRESERGVAPGLAAMRRAQKSKEPSGDELFDAGD